jgi:hypothetical protein
MTVYFGLPVRYDEAIRIFGLNLETIMNYIKTHYEHTGTYYNPFIIEYLNMHLKDASVNIKIFNTDKGQYIIGYELKEVSDLWNKFINMDEFIILILKLKKQFYDEMQILNADLAEVTLEHMEGEPEIVKNPVPYIIAY